MLPRCQAGRGARLRNGASSSVIPPDRRVQDNADRVRRPQRPAVPRAAVDLRLSVFRAGAPKCHRARRPRYHRAGARASLRPCWQTSAGGIAFTREEPLRAGPIRRWKIIAGARSPADRAVVGRRPECRRVQRHDQPGSISPPAKPVSSMPVNWCATVTARRSGAAYSPGHETQITDAAARSGSSDIRQTGAARQALVKTLLTTPGSQYARAPSS